MSNKDFSIRPALPEDVEGVIPLIYSSGPKAWSFVFQEGVVGPFDFLRKAFLKRGNTISYSNHFVAIKGDLVVGSLIIYKQPVFLLLTVGTAIRIFFTYGIRALRVIGRGLKTEAMIQPPKSDCLYLGHISVSESERKKGIAKEIMRYAVSANPVSKKISLDVSVENESAISLYKSLGFQVVATRNLPGSPGIVPDHHYMEVERKDFKFS
ncbi:N-acetyltransferase [Leptospira ilyithenensis]|uniref:N-acetyltransferase n=1 Tax=Leptospira ilyithenensis TaxID=2484901 RepID=A0A4R9LP06_9LEPT|nr:N-acetyltransferase [Leptospira ilyithenensis]TGN07222.1 N-acetyltransferase [Leptospira ilyithenensis]